MKNCDGIRESIGSWLDGELSPSETESMRLHLESCPECGATRRQLEKMQLTLKSVLESEASRVAFAPFWRGVQRRITEKRPWHDELSDALRGVFSAPRLAWAVPVVIALLIGVWSLDSFLPSWRPGALRNSFASVESIDAHGRNVALLREDETKTTVIWLYPEQEGENESADEPAKAGPSF